MSLESLAQKAKLEAQIKELHAKLHDLVVTDRKRVISEVCAEFKRLTEAAGFTVTTSERAVIANKDAIELCLVVPEATVPYIGSYTVFDLEVKDPPSSHQSWKILVVDAIMPKTQVILTERSVDVTEVVTVESKIARLIDEIEKLTHKIANYEPIEYKFRVYNSAEGDRNPNIKINTEVLDTLKSVLNKITG